MKLYSIDDFRIDNFRIDRYRIDNYRIDGAQQKEAEIPLSTLNVGDKVKFGSIYGEPIVWLVADKNHTGYPTDSVTLVSERIIKIMAFDAKEPSNSNTDRQNYGNNRYLHSNMRQWLNSTAAAGAWYSAQHAADAPPTVTNIYDGYNPYDQLAGFINAFTENEKAALLDTTIKVVKPSIDGGGSEIVVDKFFLASTTEVGLANENGIAEGSLLALFSDDASRICNPTAAAVSNADNTNPNFKEESAWHWWLRTPRFDHATYMRRVGVGGSLQDYGMGGSGVNGLRPACNLSDTTVISSTVDGDGCYTLV